jgi:Methyltransferase FkbM domain
MDGLGRPTPFAKVVGPQLHHESFTLFDVGCSSGLDEGWRSFGPKLRAYGFDPNIAECRRLAALERNPNVRYIPAFVDVPPDHAFVKRKADRPHFSRNPWDRLSVARSIEVIAGDASSLSGSDKTRLNLWQKTELADPNKPIYLASFATDNDITDIDFVKIDVDGADFAILSSLDSCFDLYNILGVGLEVNFVGSEAETDHTFHNTDRFMRSHGFDLFGLSVRHYSNKSLPGKYIYFTPAQSEFGRPLQGDALYLRDIVSPEASALADRLSDEKLAKLAAIFSLFQLPDCAAEVMLRFRPRLSRIVDVDRSLDLLAEQAQMDLGRHLSYRSYMAAFEANSRMFYRSRLWPLSEGPRFVRRSYRMVRDRLSRGF